MVSTSRISEVPTLGLTSAGHANSLGLIRISDVSPRLSTLAMVRLLVPLHFNSMGRQASTVVGRIPLPLGVLGRGWMVVNVLAGLFESTRLHRDDDCARLRSLVYFF